MQDFGDCWEWTASVASSGYGQFKFNNTMKGAHRIAYALTFGEVPEGLHVCHTCDNPLCCNAAHMFLGTHKDNMRDKVAKGRSGGVVGPGEDHGNAKLTESQVLAIRADTRVQREIAKEYGVSYPLVSLIKTRKLWTHI